MLLAAAGFSKAADMAAALLDTRDVKAYTAETLFSIRQTFGGEATYRTDKDELETPDERPLTAAERAAARAVFGGAIRLDGVKVVRRPDVAERDRSHDPRPHLLPQGGCEHGLADPRADPRLAVPGGRSLGGHHRGRPLRKLRLWRRALPRRGVGERAFCSPTSTTSSRATSSRTTTAGWCRGGEVRVGGPVRRTGPKRHVARPARPREGAPGARGARSTDCDHTW